MLILPTSLSFFKLALWVLSGDYLLCAITGTVLEKLIELVFLTHMDKAAKLCGGGRGIAPVWPANVSVDKFGFPTQ